MKNNSKTIKQINSALTVEEYISALPNDIKKELQKIRDFIFSIVPEVKERIAYKICVFSVKKDLVGLQVRGIFVLFML
jgi:uncharacterized protein YdhG (YjbR/CyaY superfamily)